MKSATAKPKKNASRPSWSEKRARCVRRPSRNQTSAIVPSAQMMSADGERPQRAVEVCRDLGSGRVRIRVSPDSITKIAITNSTTLSRPASGVIRLSSIESPFLVRSAANISHRPDAAR